MFFLLLFLLGRSLEARGRKKKIFTKAKQLYFYFVTKIQYDNLPFLTTEVSGMVIGSAIFGISDNSIILSLK